jgi:1-acyl-sn-glycerol-3-phosphate acyltransferase
VLNAAHPSRFVSKADVKGWPLLGSLITGAGTLYIERESRRDAMRVVHHMAERLQAHDVLTVFPEGTTGNGREMLPFHANLFQAAIAAQAPVVPVALRFVDGASGQRSDAPVFIGDTTLVASIWTTLCAHRLQAVLVYGEPQAHHGRDRRAWAQDMRTEVERLLKILPTAGIAARAWADFGEVIVHLMTADLREFYALEQLWSDGKTLAIPTR